jgi:hypothetical protein
MRNTQVELGFEVKKLFPAEFGENFRPDIDPNVDEIPSFCSDRFWVVRPQIAVCVRSEPRFPSQNVNFLSGASLRVEKYYQGSYGISRLSEFEFGRAGFDDLGVYGLGLALSYAKHPHCR